MGRNKTDGGNEMNNKQLFKFIVDNSYLMVGQTFYTSSKARYSLPEDDQYFDEEALIKYAVKKGFLKKHSLSGSLRSVYVLTSSGYNV